MSTSLCTSLSRSPRTLVSLGLRVYQSGKLLDSAGRVTIIRGNNVTLLKQGSFVTEVTVYVRAGLDCLWVTRWKNISTNPKWPHAQVVTPALTLRTPIYTTLGIASLGANVFALIEKSHLLCLMSWRLHMFAKILGNVVRHCRNSCGRIPCARCRPLCIWDSSGINSSKNNVVEP